MCSRCKGTMCSRCKYTMCNKMAAAAALAATPGEPVRKHQQCSTGKAAAASPLTWPHHAAAVAGPRRQHPAAEAPAAACCKCKPPASAPPSALALEMDLHAYICPVFLSSASRTTPKAPLPAKPCKHDAGLDALLFQ